MVTTEAQLALLLDGCHLEPAEDMRFLVAADYAQEQGYRAVEHCLRLLARSPRRLATGSRAYGTPQPDSDWDWVVKFGRHRDFADVLTPADSHTISRADTDHYGDSDMLVGTARFGPLNLIAVTAESQWNIWKDGTQYLLAESGLEGPRTRDRAVQVFQQFARRVREERERGS